MSKKSESLSPKQAAALEGIKAFIQDKGYSPSTRELAEQLRYKSNSTVHELLDKLEAKGFISKGVGGPRTIRVLKEEESTDLTERTNSSTYTRMEAALRNILDISQDDFARDQARYGLGIDK